MKKKLFICFSIIISSFFVSFPLLRVSAAEVPQLAIRQDYDQGNSYYIVGKQSSGKPALDGTSVNHTYSMPALTTGDSMWGAGTFHYSIYQGRMTSIHFDFALYQPNFQKNTDYEFYLDSVFDFYMGSYRYDGVITCDVTLKFNDNMGSLVYRSNNIWDSEYLDNQNVLRIDLGKLANGIAFNNDYWVTRIQITFNWETYTSSAEGMTVFAQRPNYIPYYDNMADAPIYPDYDNAIPDDYNQFENDINQSITDNLDSVTDLFESGMSFFNLTRWRNTFLYIGNCLITLSNFEFFSTVLYVCLSLGILAFLFTGFSLLSRYRNNQSRNEYSNNRNEYFKARTAYYNSRSRRKGG